MDIWTFFVPLGFYYNMHRYEVRPVPDVAKQPQDIMELSFLFWGTLFQLIIDTFYKIPLTSRKEQYAEAKIIILCEEDTILYKSEAPILKVFKCVYLKTTRYPSPGLDYLFYFPAEQLYRVNFATRRSQEVSHLFGRKKTKNKCWSLNCIYLICPQTPDFHFIIGTL